MYYVTKLQGNPLFKITLNETPCLQPVLQTVNGLVLLRMGLKTQSNVKTASTIRVTS